MDAANARQNRASNLLGENWQWLGQVTNTSAPAVNNGTIVPLQRSR